MRKLLLRMVLALMVVAFVAEDTSACIFKRRARANCCPPAPCCAPVAAAVPAGPAVGSLAELLKVLEPAKSPEVSADLAKLLGLKSKSMD